MSNIYIIAIDFGTAYSGYAFSMTATEKEAEPHLKVWGEEVGLETEKTPTCILFDEQEKFMHFGYEARKAYRAMPTDETRKKFFFDCFKMSLYNEKLYSDVTIKAANGKSMNALKVFTEALRYLKEGALKSIAQNTSQQTFTASDFTWALTVPAIWNHPAKQFMREAATQAGIVTISTQDKLVIALESEAASVWCKTLPREGFITQHLVKNALDQKKGTKYVVADCGGGTIDITVHEVLDGGALKELHKASGNDLGGQSVDKKFKEFLRKIFCDGVWDQYEKKYPNEVQHIIYEFAALKKKDADVEFICPYNLGALAQKKKEIEKFFELVDGASWDEGSIKISKKKLRSFFAESLDGITESLNLILKKLDKIEYILLVGGYAESEILRQDIIDKFGHQYSILCPCRPQEAVLKGAVMFARNPAVVAFRKSAYTYGVGVAEEFDNSQHRKDKMYKNSGGLWCGDIFMKLVGIDEDVAWDDIKNYTLQPTYPEQTKIKCVFYLADETNPHPKYVDEKGIEKLQFCGINSPDTTHGMKRDIQLEIKFGFTEMIATVTDKDSKNNFTLKLHFDSKP